MIDFHALERRFYDALLAADAKTVAGMMDPVCRYIHSDGSVDTRDSYLDRLSQGDFLYERMDFTQDQVIERGDIAVIIGTVSGRAIVRGAPRELVNCRTSVWGRTDDQWTLIAFQATPMPKVG